MSAAVAAKMTNNSPSRQRSPFLRAVLSGVLLALSVAGVSARAGDLVGYKVLPINNGLNSLRLQGHELLGFRAWRENFNAHGFDLVTLYMRNKVDGKLGAWNLVPIFSRQKGDEKEQFELTVSGGADCVLQDFRLLAATDNRPAQLIVARRDLGESYADAATVHFDYYMLAENADGDPGWPSFYFKAEKTTSAKAPYCDVNEAFDKELQLGTTSGAGGPGG
jgi:hypothetical protein